MMITALKILVAFFMHWKLLIGRCRFSTMTTDVTRYVQRTFELNFNGNLIFGKPQNVTHHGNFAMSVKYFLYRRSNFRKLFKVMFFSFPNFSILLLAAPLQLTRNASQASNFIVKISPLFLEERKQKKKQSKTLFLGWVHSRLSNFSGKYFWMNQWTSQWKWIRMILYGILLQNSIRIGGQDETKTHFLVLFPEGTFKLEQIK